LYLILKKKIQRYIQNLCKHVHQNPLILSRHKISLKYFIRSKI